MPDSPIAPIIAPITSHNFTVDPSVTKEDVKKSEKDLKSAERWETTKTVALNVLKFLALALATVAALALTGVITIALAPEILIVALVVAVIAFEALTIYDHKRSRYYSRLEPMVINLRQIISGINNEIWILDPDDKQKLNDMNQLKQRSLILLKNILTRAPEETVRAQFKSLTENSKPHNISHAVGSSKSYTEEDPGLDSILPQE